MELTKDEEIMISTLRRLNLHPSNALASLNMSFYGTGNMYIVETLADVIEEMEDKENEI